MPESGEKTERATPKKRRDERKKGHVALSKDIVGVATLVGSVVMLRLTFIGSAEKIAGFMAYCFALAREPSSEVVPRELLLRSVLVVVQVLWPLFLVGVALAVIATFAQTRALVTAEPIKPKFSKISPIQGFKRLFSLNSIVEVLKGIFKIVILLYIIYTSLRDQLAVSERYLYADLGGACAHLFGAIFSMLMKVVAAFFVLAAVDYFYQWWDYERQMRMTKQEVKEEYKQTEGDPQVKGRIKEVQRRMAQSRMMQQVPGADVIIRNPTHVAVALRYRPGEDEAPVVLAKGLDYMALRIVDVAQAHDIVTIENVPLARALYAQAELNAQIPADLYEAVAEVMVYLYKIGRLGAQGALQSEIQA